MTISFSHEILEQGRELRDQIMPYVDEGFHCPCCGRRVQRYARSMSSEMAHFLVDLYRASCMYGRDRYFTLRELHPSIHHVSGNGFYLRYWGLVEVRLGDDGHELKNPMYYRITDDGIAFVKRERTVRRRVVTLCGELEGFIGDEITIVDAINNRFDLDEILASPLYLAGEQPVSEPSGTEVR